MSIADSLKALGIDIRDAVLVTEGINRLILPREQKLKLLREYAKERNITDLKSLEEKIE